MLGVPPLAGAEGASTDTAASTPLTLPSTASERLARLSNRRRSISSTSHAEPSASMYMQGVEEGTRAKEKEVERYKARLKESMQEAGHNEDAARQLAQEVEALAAQLQLRQTETSDLQRDNAALQRDARHLHDLRRRYQMEAFDSRRERLAAKERELRLHTICDESELRADLLSRFATSAAASTCRLQVECAALRKQVKDMQIRMQGLVDAGKESLRQMARPQPDPPAMAPHEALREELSAMRREKNEAVGALRAERASHAALLERFHSAESARDAALRQLAELPDLERQIEQLSRSRLGETAWQQDRANLEQSLRQKGQELAAMTKKREKAKRKEAEAQQELARLKRGYVEHQRGEMQRPALQAVPALAPQAYDAQQQLQLQQQPASRADTPASWQSGHLNLGDSAREAEVAFLRSRVRELTHQGRYAAGFATPPPGVPTAP